MRWQRQQQQVEAEVAGTGEGEFVDDGQGQRADGGADESRGEERRIRVGFRGWAAGLEVESGRGTLAGHGRARLLVVMFSNIQ